VKTFVIGSLSSATAVSNHHDDGDDAGRDDVAGIDVA
jgi:hypothetical protein